MMLFSGFFFCKYHFAHSSDPIRSAIIFSEPQGGYEYADRFQNTACSIWLLLAILKLVFKIAAGAAAFVLTISGGLLLVYDLFLLIIGLGSKELMLQLLTIGGLLIAVPLLAGIMTSLLEAAQEPIKEFIES